MPVPHLPPDQAIRPGRARARRSQPRVAPSRPPPRRAAPLRSTTTLRQRRHAVESPARYARGPGESRDRPRTPFSESGHADARADPQLARPRESAGRAVRSPADNEQMEFLGDAVLGFLVSEALVRRFPSYPEGDLSKLKAHLVSAAHLYDVARKLELGQYLFLGRGEEMSGGRDKRTLLVDCLEALIAALTSTAASTWRELRESLDHGRRRDGVSARPGDPRRVHRRFQKRAAGAGASRSCRRRAT